MTQRFVLDCSVAISWCLEDENSAYADKVLDSLATHIAIVPPLWGYEISNTLLVSLRRNRITEALLYESLVHLQNLPIEIDDTSMSLTDLTLLSLKYGLTAYDGAYLKISLQQGLPLATHDKKMAEAIVAAGGKLYLK